MWMEEEEAPLVIFPMHLLTINYKRKGKDTIEWWNREASLDSLP